LGLKIKTKLLEKCREWKHGYLTRKLKMRLAGVKFKNEWRKMEIDSSRVIQKFGSSMMLNGCILLIIGVHMPWFYFGKFYVSIYDGVFLFPDYLFSNAIYFVVPGGFLFFLVVRSLIVKKFLWEISIFISSGFLLLVIVNYFFLKRKIHENLKVSTVTGPGVWFSGLAALLITMSALLIYFSRKKDKKRNKKEMYNWEKRRRRKRPPVKR